MNTGTSSRSALSLLSFNLRNTYVLGVASMEAIGLWMGTFESSISYECAEKTPDSRHLFREEWLAIQVVPGCSGACSQGEFGTAKDSIPCQWDELLRAKSADPGS